MFGKRKIAALVAEFLGTGILAFTFLSVSRSTIGIPYFVGLAAGLAVVLMGLALARDVHLNPAYTLALWTGRRIKASKALAFILVQLLGGFAAYGLYKYLTKGQVQPLSGEFDSRIMVSEALGTFVFAFAAAGALYQRVHWVVRAIIVGGAYTLGIMIASAASNGFINPAVALASNGWSWGTTVAGPILGAIIGVNLYGLLFAVGEPSVVRAKRDIRDDRDEEPKTVKAAAIVESAAESVKEEVAKAKAKAKSSKKRSSKK